MNVINEVIIRQINVSLKQIENEHYFTLYANVVNDEINSANNILGPLCSVCEFAEPTIDYIESTRSDGEVEWTNLVNISCRCTKTNREYLCRQIYLSGNGKVEKINDKYRHPGRITYKIGCMQLEIKKDLKQEA